MGKKKEKKQKKSKSKDKTPKVEKKEEPEEMGDSGDELVPFQLPEKMKSSFQSMEEYIDATSKETRRIVKRATGKDGQIPECLKCLICQNMVYDP